MNIIFSSLPSSLVGFSDKPKLFFQRLLVKINFSTDLSFFFFHICTGIHWSIILTNKPNSLQKPKFFDKSWCTPDIQFLQIWMLSRWISWTLLYPKQTRCSRGFSSNTSQEGFYNMFLDKTCPLENCLKLDSLPHLLACRVLQGAVPRSPSVQYGDVFSPDQGRQEEATVLFGQLLAARDKLPETDARIRPDVSQPQPSAYLGQYK